MVGSGIGCGIYSHPVGLVGVAKTVSLEHILQSQGDLKDQQFAYPKNLLRQKIVNNLARLFFTLRNKNSLTRLFPEVIF